MRFKLTLVLLLANLVVFFVLWRLEQPAALVPKAPGPIAKDFYDHILIEDNTANPAQIREFKRDANGNWNIVQPIIWPANSDTVTLISSELQFLDPEISFSQADLAKGGQSLKDFGLDKPILKVTLENAKGKQLLLVGSPTVYAGRLYVMNPADGMVRVISQGDIASLYAPIEQLRDNRIFTTNAILAKSLSLWTAPNKLVEFIKDNTTDLWQLDAPLRRPADSVALNQVVALLAKLSVENFLAPKDTDPARQGLAQPRLTIKLSGDASQKLSVGDDVPNSPQPQVYAQLEDSKIVFTVAKTGWFDTLLQAQDKLRQHLFLDFDPAKVSALNLSSTTGELRLQKVGQSWQISDKDASGAPRPIYDADARLMQGLLETLQSLSALNFTSDAPDALAPFGLDPANAANPPLWKVVIQADKPVTLTLGHVGDNGANRFYAKTSDTDSVYEINGDILDLLDTNPLSYRDRVLEQLPTGALITSLKLTDLKDNHELFSFDLPDTKPKWDDFLKGNPAFANDPGNLRRSATLSLLNSLAKFDVAFYRESAFSPTGQTSASGSISTPWRFLLDFTVEIPAAGQTPAQKFVHQFYFSDLLAGGVQIGGTPGDPALPTAVFRITQNLIGALGTLTDAVTTPPEVQKALSELSQPLNPNPPAAPAATPAPAAAPAPPAASTPVAP